MSVAAAHRARPDRWMMGLFLASDGAGFAALLVAHTLLSTDASGRAVQATLNVPLAAAMTAALISSSFTAHRWLAGAGALWGWCTLGLGSAFVVAQAFEWWHALDAVGMSADSSPFAATFFGCTGFHGLHVLVGLLLFVLLLLSGRTMPGSPFRERARENAVLYWHFVDVVWIVVFLRVYVL